MLNRLFDHIINSLTWVAAVLMVYIVLSVDYEVVSRYFFNRPVVGVVDLSEYCLLYILFLTTAWTLKGEGHVKVDLLLTAFPSGIQRVINISTSFVGAAASAVFCFFSLWMTIEALLEGAILWKALMVPKWSIYIIMPLGSLLLVLQFVRRAWLYWNRQEMPQK